MTKKKQADKIASGAQGLIGVQFEKWLEHKLGGGGPFKKGGREFDGAITPNRWYEAKSGRYWTDHAKEGPSFDKFKSDIGAKAKIAKENNATFEVHSNTPIPQHVKDWLTKRNIPFYEHLE